MFDWNGFLDLAERLAQGDDEASHRTAISRAYYFAFHRARLFVLSRGVALPRTGEAHDVVWEVLACAGKGLRGAAAMGLGLRKMRRKSDYDREFLGIGKGKAQDAVKLARAIVRLLGLEAGL